MTVICILLFIGAMGKSAQFPLHVWLPDSMEGPTPISALIHAATMVTAGIFMVARMSPLFELSETALSFVMVIGAITALFMGLVAIVQNDIKRVVAYSTLSQLGYMTVALGASAYAAGIFHLATHAFFKAVLFLGAGSVIIAMHHEQDMRRMGGLRKYMPITYITVLIGSFANAGFPGFSGFFSKDAIIEAVQLSHTPGSAFAYFCVLASVFVTGLYSFRLVYMTFHGKERFGHAGEHAGQHTEHGHDEHGEGGAAAAVAHAEEAHEHHPLPKESPAVVTVPLILLAIPSVCAGWLIGTVLYGGYFGGSIFVLPQHDVLGEMAHEFHGAVEMTVHAFSTAPAWLAIAGILTATVLYLFRPEWAARLKSMFGIVYTILDHKYWFDELYSWLFASGARMLGTGLWRGGDVAVIDGVLVNGSARAVGGLARVMRRIQSGILSHYAFAMIIGILILLTMIFLV
jgi:NADH-quinone oxidoreductase subunit L